MKTPNRNQSTRLQPKRILVGPTISPVFLCFVLETHCTKNLVSAEIACLIIQLGPLDAKLLVMPGIDITKAIPTINKFLFLLLEINLLIKETDQYNISQSVCGHYPTALLAVKDFEDMGILYRGQSYAGS